ncbi:MAG: Domain Protein Beta Propeller [Bacteroidetes bacterium]|nr:Domain Protein Beta Propeller [Bacteroidota bacterium]
MKSLPLRLLLVCVLIVLVCRSGEAQLYSYHTRNLQLIYLDKAHAYVVPHLARCFENSLQFHRRLFDYTPTENVTTLLHDFNDYGSGGTNTIPWNYLSIGIEPYDYTYETSPTNERMNWVMNHELVHVVATDKATGVDNFFRSIFFGKVAPEPDNPITMIYTLYTSPRWYSPRWYHEGIAVFLETWMAGGIGRVLGGYDEMVFRTMVHDSSYFYDYVGLESEGTTIDFQIGANAYLYGTRFVSYLAYQYTPEKVLQWFNRSADSKRYFATQFEHVFGRPLTEEWERWVDWEHQWQKANLDSIHRYPVTPYRAIAPEPLGSVSRSFTDNGKLYLAVNYPGKSAHIAAIDLRTGAEEQLCKVTGPALYYVSSTAYDSSTGSLFFTTHNGSSWRDLHVLNVRTGDEEELLSDARVGDLVFNRRDSSLWGIQHHNGLSKIVRIPHPYRSWFDVVELEYGKDLFDLDISPDGQRLSATLIEINGRQRLIMMSLDSLARGNASFDGLYEFENNSPQNFVFSPDGKSLFGTTYLTGVSNVVRYDFDSKHMHWVTNTETGLFRPLPLSADSLIAFRYTGQGFLPVKIANGDLEDVSAIQYLGQQVVDKHPIVADWKLAPPSAVDIDTLRTYAGEYNGLSHLNLSSVYPMVEGYKDYTAIGARAGFQDYLSIYGLTLNASYTPQPGVPQDERFHFATEFRWWQWKISGSYNGTDFYDLFGPTKSSRKGYSAGIRVDDHLIFDKPTTLEYSLSFYGYGGLEVLPEFQNIASSIDHFFSVGGRLRYSYLTRTLGAVEDEQGIICAFNNSTRLSVQGAFPHFWAGLDVGGQFLFDHSTIWFRSSAGYSPGARDNSLANFYFGGFGNNWVDYQNVQRYREFYSFPGIEINAAGGTTFGKAMLEWDLPPLRFRQLGLPSFYCTWTRLALFSSLLVTNPDSKPDQQRVVNAGAQIDFKLVLFSHLNSTLSFGYARAAMEGRHPTGEFMFSLKLL